MTDLSKPNWFDIKRESPELEAKIEGRLFLFNYFNTHVYVYPIEFDNFNHVYHMPEQHPIYIFGAQVLMDELVEHDFPMSFEPWPSPDDVEAYIQSELQDLDT